MSSHGYELTMPVMQPDLPGITIDTQHTDYFVVTQNVECVVAIEGVQLKGLTLLQSQEHFVGLLEQAVHSSANRLKCAI